MLKSGFSLNCKIYQRFCLKGTDLQEDVWAAYLIRGNRQYFPVFFIPLVWSLCVYVEYTVEISLAVAVLVLFYICIQ